MNAKITETAHALSRPRRRLAAQLAGELLVPSDSGYPAARTGFDLAQQHEPSLIVMAAAPGDVAAALRFADHHGIPVAVQATGHGTTVRLHGGLLINTRRLSKVSVDPDRRSARVQAGATWGEVVAAASPHGLAPLCGSAPSVGAVGYLLGGGIGPIGRRYGFGADRVAALTMVTVSGDQLDVSATSEPDLFWGVRGAGANFGVITEVEIELEPIDHVYGGGLFFPGEAAGEVLAAFTETIADAPEALSLSVACLQFPSVPTVPSPLRGRFSCHVRICHVGEADEAEAHVHRLRASASAFLDTVAELPFSRIGSIHADPVRPMPVNCRSQVLSTFDIRAAELVSDTISHRPPFLIELRHLGGALARLPNPGNAVGHRTGMVNLFTSAYPGTDPAGSGRAQHDFIQTLSSYSDGGSMLNFLQGSHVSGSDIQHAYDEGTWQRLTELKHTWDPDNRLRHNHNVPPHTR